MHHRPPTTRGFSLIELLMALALTLVMMAAVVAIFGMINTSMTDSRATVEMNSRLQAAADRLQRDLDGLTAPVVPWLRPESGQGYFEYIEGPRSDYSPPQPPQLTAGYSPVPDGKLPLALVGDIDDVLMFTTRARGQPFVGRTDPQPGTSTSTGPQIIQSDVAEVIYFCAPDPTSAAQAAQLGRETLYTLYRQVRLVYPTSKIFEGPLPRLPSLDVSYRVESTPSGQQFLLNSLGDLTKRENRAYRALKGFPFSIYPGPEKWPYGPPPPQGNGNPRILPDGSTLDTTSRLGLDVLLSNVLAFDVKAWDPTATVRSDSAGSRLLQPGELNYTKATNVVTTGAYVDLNYARAYGQSDLPANFPPSLFSGFPNPRSGGTTPPFYDTWPLHYEYDGVDQDGQAGADQATNGLDDNPNDANNAGVDDASERETSPPYPVPLRGIQVRIRTYEPDSRQVRQVTVNGDFLAD
jgi:prepilin-type N-terminal cleavage/methylation domain-containing protein